MGDGEREIDVLSYPFIPSFFLLPTLPTTQSSSVERSRVFFALYYYMKNFCNLIGLEQWYFGLI